MAATSSISPFVLISVPIITSSVFADSPKSVSKPPKILSELRTSTVLVSVPPKADKAKDIGF